MTQETMSIQQALNELKLLDKRINKSINSLISATYIQNEKLPKEYKNEEDFQNIAKANYASATDLIKRRNLIKGKILNSNANTLVTIAGDTMTVLEAIDRKTSIAYEQLLVDKLSNEYTKASRHVDMTNMAQDSEASNKINGITSSKDESSKELIKAITDLYEGKKAKLIGAELEQGVKTSDLISILDDKINEFLSEVDYKLTESNVKTTITL